MVPMQKLNIHIISNAIVAVIFFILVMLGVIAAGKKSAPVQQAGVSDSVSEQSDQPRQFSRLEAEHKFQNYVVSIYKNSETTYPPHSSLQVARDGNIIYRQDGLSFRFGHPEFAEQYDYLIPIGTDITGTGAPNLVITEWSGGNSRCFKVSVYDLGNESFRKITEFSDNSGHFEKRNQEKGLVFFQMDPIFFAWKSSNAESPMPEVILAFREGEYRIAIDLMWKPAPSLHKLESLSATIRNDSSWSNNTPPVMLWKTMLDLIYSGNADSAWKLLDMTWPDKVAGKSKFIRDFKQRLAESDYWEQIKLLNAGNCH